MRSFETLHSVHFLVVYSTYLKLTCLSENNIINLTITWNTCAINFYKLSWTHSFNLKPCSIFFLGVPFMTLTQNYDSVLWKLRLTSSAESRGLKAALKIADPHNKVDKKVLVEVDNMHWWICMLFRVNRSQGASSSLIKFF